MQITRQRIVDLLRRQGQATVEELADAVDLTAMAVRHHLNVLQADDLIEVIRTRRHKRPGRPVQMFGLTSKAKKLHPQEYFQLTNMLLTEMVDRLGKVEVEEIFSKLAERFAEEAPPTLKNQSFEERLDQVVSFLKEKGFPVKWGIENNKYVIHHLDCPYRQLAREHQEVCLMDKKVISHMLQITPQRVSCIACQDDKCTYVLIGVDEAKNAPIELFLPN